MKLPDISVIWPEWSITGYLGRDVYASYYLAESTLDGNTVYSSVKAIKMPQNEEFISEIYKNGVSPENLTAYFDKFKDKLNWEMRIFKSVTSPYIMQIDDMRILENPEHPGWIAFIRNGLFTPLADYICQVDFDQCEVLRLGREICKALMVCSRSGMIHGHVSTDNIYVMDNGEFVLSDFGLRRCLESAGNLLFPKPDDTFDAPEVKEKGDYSEASDIYSLGRIMDKLIDVACWRGLEDRDGTVDGGLLDIIATATEEDPVDRYQNAATMLANLNSIELKSKTLVRRTASSALARETAEKFAAAEAEREASESENSEAEGDDAPKKQDTAEEITAPLDRIYNKLREHGETERKHQAPEPEKKGFFQKLFEKFKKND